MDLYHLGRLSVDGVVRLENKPLARDILTVVERALADSLAARVVLNTLVDLPTLAQEAVRWAIEQAESRPRVSAFAEALAMSPRGLSGELREAGLASPGTLLLWGRLIRATHLLERPSETVESVAFRLGYATGGALGKAFKRHVGYSPTEIFHRGGLAWTLDVFGRKALRKRGSR
jgi:AraC-like DNA-binding protein